MPASTAICGANDTLNRGSLKTSSGTASDAASVIRMVSIAARSRSGRNRQSDNASPTTAAIMIAAYSPIVTARRTVRKIRSWAAHATAAETAETARFDQLTNAQELIDATQRSDGDAGNSLLLLLVELARHDALAGRIVVQRLLPGLISAAAKYRFLSEAGDPVEEAVGAAWITIRNYDIAKRTRHVAAGLISDAIYLAFRRDARRQVPAETPTEPRLLGERVACPPSPALVELADVVRMARLAGVDTHDLDLIRALVCTGSPSAVARQQCVTPRTIRNRRDRAIRRLQQAVAVAA